MSELTQQRREALAGWLKGERMNSAKFVESLQAADLRTLGLAIKECILRPHGPAVNRQRVEFLIDTLINRVTLVPPIELAEQKAQTAQKPQKAGKGGK